MVLGHQHVQCRVLSNTCLPHRFTGCLWFCVILLDQVPSFKLTIATSHGILRLKSFNLACKDWYLFTSTYHIHFEVNIKELYINKINYSLHYKYTKCCVTTSRLQYILTLFSYLDIITITHNAKNINDKHKVWSIFQWYESMEVEIVK